MTRRNERGMVTAELAVTLLAVVLVAVATVWAGLACLQQVRVGAVAGQVARQEARGDASQAREIAAKNKELRVDVRRDGGYVHVTVSGVSAKLGVLPGLAVSARAEVVLEPGEQQ